MAISEVACIIGATAQGDPHAASRLLSLVYGELRKLAAQRMAQEQPGQTLQPTALVHEAYVKPVGPRLRSCPLVQGFTGIHGGHAGFASMRAKNARLQRYSKYGRTPVARHWRKSVRGPSLSPSASFVIAM